MTKRTLLVAVSGGVDSVVLLDVLRRGNDRLIVAHVDHGIRHESDEDARFVAGLAKVYGVPYVSTRLALGADASEDTARRARYTFLENEARRLNATIVTAHHYDDLIGSVAINIVRGTGWRGLAVMARPDILRPLLGWTKANVYSYALGHGLEWVEDSTNLSKQYLRNRLRGDISRLPGTVKQTIFQLRAAQLVLARSIDAMTKQVVERHAGSRHFYTTIDSQTAVELLRTEIERAVGERPTIIHAERALLAIKTARSGSTHELGAGVSVSLSTRSFIVARHLR